MPNSLVPRLPEHYNLKPYFGLVRLRGEVLFCVSFKLPKDIAFIETRHVSAFQIEHWQHFYLHFWWNRNNAMHETVRELRVHQRGISVPEEDEEELTWEVISRSEYDMHLAFQTVGCYSLE